MVQQVNRKHEGGGEILFNSIVSVQADRHMFQLCSCTTSPWLIRILQGHTPQVLEHSVTLRIVIPIGIATAGDILLSNLSFMYATVSFYTIVKSGSLMW